DLSASLIELLIVDQHFPRENQSRRTFSRGSQAAFDEEFVESEFQGWLKIGELWRQPELICRRTTKVPALAAVQNAEPSLAESLTKIRSCFSTEFSTVVLKTFSAQVSLIKKSR